MKINFIIIFVFLFSFSVFSQFLINNETLDGNKYTLNFQIQPPQYKIITKDKLKIIKFIGYEDESKSGEFVNPSKDLLIPIPVNSHPEITLIADKKISIEGRPSVNPIIEISGDSVINYKYLDLPVKYGKKELFKIKGFLWIGNHYCVHIKVNLSEYDLPSNTTYIYNSFILTLLFKNIVRENNNVEKKGSNILNKYLIDNIFESNTGRPSYKVNSNDSWIDYTKNYLKIGVAKDAIYRIYPQDLTALGIDVSQINPLTFKLINKGEELPIYVQGEEDNHFDSKDFVEFIGIRNMGGHYREVAQYGHPYNEYLGRYTDTSVYWLTWGGDLGKRVIVSTGDSQLNSVDTLKYYNQIIHNEINKWFDFSMRDQVRREMPYWWENKSWFEGQIGVGTRGRNFNVSDVYPNQTTKLFIKVQDYASNIYTNAHLLSLSLNSEPTIYDSGYVNKYETKVFSAEVNSNLLQEGKNTLYIHYYPTEANPNTCQIDWDEEEYPRYLKAIGDSLNFQFNYLTNSSIKVITVTNIDSSNMIYWKYGESYKKYEINVQNNMLSLIDTVDNGNKFILVNDQKVNKPKFYYIKKFRNLSSSQNSAQYIAITNKKFLNECSNYIQFISQNYNISTTSVDIHDIYDEFAYGYFNPESIRDFLEATNMYWQDPKPQYVFLIGTANYDYYGNKVKNFGAPPKYNLVPSFGFPVSDAWFVIWDTTGANIPQMDIGRLPAKNVQEFQHYFDKHKNYLTKGLDEWNKRYIFFSGGNFTDTSQIGQLKRINDFIIENYIAPAPVGGEVSHFYKTVNPVTNFGPYTGEKVQSAINNGGVFISYLGHSGTETWDNSITDPSQLKNDVDRNPIITDYGCSTAKFAEPDVTSFSELTVNRLDGQAIAYIANSSLGFTSTSYVFPQIFFKNIFEDSIYNIGDAHRLSKIELLNDYGSSGTYQLFTLTNTLIGDPIINIPIPPKTNLSILKKDIHILPVSPNDNDDSVIVKLYYKNLGKAINDSVEINVSDEYSGNIIYQKSYLRKIPLYIDSLQFPVLIRNKPGNHLINVVLDKDKKIDELSKEDNQASIQISVLTSSLRNTSLYKIENQIDGNVKFINPSSDPFEKNFIIEISNENDFNNPASYTIPLDSFYTKFTISASYNNSRIWLRSKLSGAKSFGQSQSFYVSNKNGYLLNDSTSFLTADFKNLKVNINKITADTSKITLEAISAGYNDGKTAIISKNGQNFIPENTLRGHHICLFDENTLDFVQYKLFDVLLGGDEITNYISFLDTLSNKYVILIAVSDEGSISNSDLKNEIKSIGSKYIDNLKFRGSWCIVGRKGAIPGSVPEAISDPFQGRVQIDTTISLGFNFGNMVTSRIGPVAEWKSLTVSQTIPAGTSIKYKPLGIRSDGIIDTLNYLTVDNGTADVSGINGNIYPYLKIFAEFNINNNSISPAINSLSVEYSEPPELGTNYQVVSSSLDTVDAGKSNKLEFYVYNVGGSEADSFKVKVNVIKPDNSTSNILNQLVPRLQNENKKYFEAEYVNKGIGGRYDFHIEIDFENKIKELYKDNNVYDKFFVVKGDTTTRSVTGSSMIVKFDGHDILDGDYVSTKPDIQMELNYPIWFNFKDTSAIKFLLDDRNISHSQLLIVFDSLNYRISYEYKPTLTNGEHSLKIFGENISGTFDESPGYEKSFTTLNEIKILDVYNYPNPFSKNTYFTFKLTQIPDELKIRIFTVAGRLVREIDKHASDLNYNFNKIYWNGRDQDGDMLANGVYFYKITLVKGDKKDNVIQKMAIVR